MSCDRPSCPCNRMWLTDSGSGCCAAGAPKQESVPPAAADPAHEIDAAAEAVYTDALALLLRKHLDYGPSNIAGSPGGPLNGLRVRMWDKLARINHLVDTGRDPANESLRDSFLDMLNYSAIALLVLDGNWPN